MSKITFPKAEIQHVEWVKNSMNGNPQYRITFNTYSGQKNDLIRNSWSMLTEANANFAYAISENRYNNGTPKTVILDATRSTTRSRITNLTELR